MSAFLLSVFGAFPIWAFITIGFYPLMSEIGRPDIGRAVAAFAYLASAAVVFLPLTIALSKVPARMLARRSEWTPTDGSGVVRRLATVALAAFISSLLVSAITTFISGYPLWGTALVSSFEGIAAGFALAMFVRGINALSESD
jgi:hypothetical protein